MSNKKRLDHLVKLSRDNPDKVFVRSWAGLWLVLCDGDISSKSTKHERALQLALAHVKYHQTIARLIPAWATR